MRTVEPSRRGGGVGGGARICLQAPAWLRQLEEDAALGQDNDAEGGPA